jgi:hypothetical protein
MVLFVDKAGHICASPEDENLRQTDSTGCPPAGEQHLRKDSSLCSHFREEKERYLRWIAYFDEK